MSSTTPQLQCIIVGAGLGGLAAAFCFAKNGYKVQVFEQRSGLSTRGSGIMIRSSASRCLLSWGLGPDFEAVADVVPATILRNLITGEVAVPTIAIDISEYPDWGIDRQSAQQILYSRACEAGAEVVFNAAVESVNDDTASVSVTLKDGKRLSAGLVIAADGIRSRMRSIILSDTHRSVDPIISCSMMYGVKLPKHQLKADPRTEDMVKKSHLNVWTGSSRYVVGRMGVKSGIWSGFFGARAESSLPGLWDEEGDINLVRKLFADADPTLVAALEICESCDRWRLAELPDLPRWTSKQGRVILLGDSAHAMQPNAAQGFSQTIEDVAVLEYLLSSQRNATIPILTELWEACRKPRVERIKAYAAWNTTSFTNEMILDVNSMTEMEAIPSQSLGLIKSMRHVRPDHTAEFHTSRFLKWALDYDAVFEAKKFVSQIRSNI